MLIHQFPEVLFFDSPNRSYKDLARIQSGLSRCFSLFPLDSIHASA